jgi:aspartate aminotransferase
MTTQPYGRRLDLSIGDPGYEPPREVQAVVVRAIARGLGGYAPMGGLPKLRVALAERLSARNGVDTSPDQVTVTSGASLGVFATLSTVCAPGDLVLVPDPGFPLYRLAAATLGLRVAAYPAAAGQPDWAALDELAPGARLLLWNYPSNPLGHVADPAWFGRLFALLDRNPRLTLLSDEVYEDLVLDGTHGNVAAAAGPLADRIVSVFSFSKCYGMAAWRIGYVHARADWAQRIGRAQWAAAMSTPTAAQLGALAALRTPAEYLDERRAFLRANRDLAVERMRSFGLPCASPSAGFFVWAHVSDATFAERCAAETGVLLSPGTDFGPSGAGQVRLNYAVPPDRLAEALGRLQAWTVPDRVPS